MEIPIFQCQRCTNCCRNVFTEEDKSFGLILFDFEAEILRRKAREKKLALSLKPVNFVPDKNSKKAIVIFWRMENRECPFLEKDECVIYGERPLVCRAFPVVSTGVFKNGEMIRSMLCPREQDFPGFGTKDSLITALKKLMQRYRENFLSCYLLEKIEENEKKLIEMLIKEEKIKPRKEKKGFKFIGFMEYLRNNKMLDNDYESDLFKEISSLAKTREEINRLISAAENNKIK